MLIVNGYQRMDILMYESIPISTFYISKFMMHREALSKGCKAEKEVNVPIMPAARWRMNMYISTEYRKADVEAY